VARPGRELGDDRADTMTTLLKPATKAKTRPEMRDNGHNPHGKYQPSARYPCPSHVRYRGVVRRVYGAIPAIHQGHRHYLLRCRRGHVPRDAVQTVVGTRGQAHVRAVIVRADHVTPVDVSAKPTGGRPKLRKRRSTARTGKA